MREPKANAYPLYRSISTRTSSLLEALHVGDIVAHNPLGPDY
jgi:hypothetical protein